MFYLGAYIKVAHPSTAAGAAVSASTAAGGRAATAAIMLFGIIFCASWNGLAWIIVRPDLVVSLSPTRSLTQQQLGSARRSIRSGSGRLLPRIPRAVSGYSSSSLPAARPPCHARLGTACSSSSEPSASAPACLHTSSSLVSTIDLHRPAVLSLTPFPMSE